MTEMEHKTRHKELQSKLPSTTILELMSWPKSQADNPTSLPEDSHKEPPYGYCPICGAIGVLRERRLNGNDTCENGHVYASRDAVKKILAKT